MTGNERVVTRAPDRGHFGVRNIRLGPTLPAFVAPNVLKVLSEKCNLMSIKTVDQDLRSILLLAP